MYWITSSIVQSAGAPLGNCWCAEIAAVPGVLSGEEENDGDGEAGKPVAVIVVVGSVADGDPVVWLLPVAAGAGLDVLALLVLCRLCDPVDQPTKKCIF